MKKGKKIAYFVLWLAAFLFCAISQAVLGHWMAVFYCVMFYLQCIPLSVLVGRIRASEGEIDRLRQMLRDEWTEKRAREQYDRMAPIYSEQDSFEVALHGAWRFYEKSGEMLVDTCEDNRTELIFSKGFREGVLYGKKTGGGQKEQKPAEWSEEDEKNFYWISTRIQQANMTPEYSAKVYEILSWLKSLRPQPHTVSIKDATKFSDLEYERGVKDGIQSEKSRQWKPSEEQINALWKLMHNAVYLSSWGELEKQIESLYRDLKKL